MKQKLLFISLIVVSINAMIIDIHEPYAQGSINITRENISEPIIFSNGVTLSWFQIAHAGIGNFSLDHWYFKVEDTTVNKVGFRPESSATIVEHQFVDMGILYYREIQNSSDTIMSNISSYPDSLISFNCYNYADDSCVGKYLFTFFKFQNGEQFLDTIGCPAIVYIHSNDNRIIAVQFNNYAFSQIGNVTSFESLTFSWATDSAGNGVFDIHTSIKNKDGKIYPYVIEKRYPSQWNVQRLPFLFNIKGQVFGKLNSGCPTYYGNGMYVIQYTRKSYVTPIIKEKIGRWH